MSLEIAIAVVSPCRQMFQNFVHIDRQMDRHNQKNPTRTYACGVTDNGGGGTTLQAIMHSLL